MLLNVRSFWLLAAISAVSLLPVARAECFIDDFGDEHCRLSDGVRIGIAIAIVVFALAIIASALRWRQRSGRTTFLAFQRPINQQNNSYGPGNGPPNYPSGYNAQGGYYPNGPQYPPYQYNSYAPPNKPFDPAENTPPPAYYAPPPGPPPAVHTATKGEAV